MRIEVLLCNMFIGSEWSTTDGWSQKPARGQLALKAKKQPVTFQGNSEPAGAVTLQLKLI